MKAVLDIQGKHKKILAGEYGYVFSQRRSNLKTGLILFGISFTIYFLGQIVFNSAEVMFNIAAMLLLLPAAQFFARYVSFSRYSALKKDAHAQLVSISDKFMVLGELPIIRGKKDYLLLSLVITDIGVFGLIKEQKSKTTSVRNCKSVESVLSDILKPRGLNKEIEVFDNFEQFEAYLRTQVKSKIQNESIPEVFEKIRETVLITVH